MAQTQFLQDTPLSSAVTATHEHSRPVRRVGKVFAASEPMPNTWSGLKTIVVVEG